MAEVENKTETEVAAAPETKVKDDKKKAAKASKPGLGARIKKFFKDNKSELKKVSWFSRKDTIRSTGVVLVAIIAVSAAISLLDLGFSNLIMWIGSLV